MNASKEIEQSVFLLDSKTKQDDKRVLQRLSFEISRERQGPHNQEKWLKDDKVSEEPMETTAESNYSELLRSRICQASNEVARGPAPYKVGQRTFF